MAGLEEKEEEEAKSESVELWTALGSLLKTDCLSLEGETNAKDYCDGCVQMINAIVERRERITLEIKWDQHSRHSSLREDIQKACQQCSMGVDVLCDISDANPLSLTELCTILITLYGWLDEYFIETRGISDCRVALTRHPKSVVSDSSEEESTALRTDLTEVVVGGTFDHLHSGHRIMLSVALFSMLDCKDHSCQLWVGLSVDELLTKKKHQRAMQTWNERRDDLTEFCAWFASQSGMNATLEVKVEKLHDLFGPSVNAGVQALVASEETAKGAAKVNEERVRLGVSKLDIHIIPLLIPGEISDEEEKSMSNKVSSTLIRERLLRRGFLFDNWCGLFDSVFPWSTSKEIHKQLRLEWFIILWSFYSERSRHYHSSSHIESMLRDWADEYQIEMGLISDRNGDMDCSHIVLLSVWFHDCVYDPSAKELNNEKMSSCVFELFLDHCCSNLMPSETTIMTMSLERRNMTALRNRVVKYILSTIKHELLIEDDAGLCVFLDLDLSVLAKENWDEYYEGYALKIRREYHFVESKDFATKRSAILKGFLKRERLFFSTVGIPGGSLTKLTSEKETRARANLAREIQVLLG